eukprot:GHVP01053125.1.p1 GENE.GHVP01053125.1~~GHVP01053125.1.p1  ORF type:complete len:292 (-),score=47.79 GHVP01053125.1:61-900(-)
MAASKKGGAAKPTQGKGIARKGKAKRIGNPFLKKEWYEIKAPAYFVKKSLGFTCATKSQGMKLASDNLKGRVFEFNLADLQDDEEAPNRQVKLSCEDVQGRSLLTDFHGMHFTRDRLCVNIKKWYDIIEAFADAKTVDGYHLRLFCFAQTRRRDNQVKSKCYFQTSKKKAIRKLMVEMMEKEVRSSTLEEIVKKLTSDSISKNIEKACGMFSLQHVSIRKVKILSKPKFDMKRLMTLHKETGPSGKTEWSSGGDWNDQGEAPLEDDPDVKNQLTAELQS